jgi:endosialidase-like protein
MKSKTNILGAMLVAFAFVCSAVLPNAHAISPAPDGGYPGGNTAEGQNALFSLTSGTYNTAVGLFSLRTLTTGALNTALGAGTLLVNTANANTATGAGALLGNTAGAGNTGNGAFALASNVDGSSNTAVGSDALLHCTGSNNTAIGSGALDNATGFANVALGFGAGSSVSTANNVICIGTEIAGADVSDTAWLGNVYGVTTQSGTTAPVIVSDTGQLGTVVSSARYKKDIANMEKASAAILSLRPVTFHYKTDTKAMPQFGLIAEEVAKVDPALVLPDKEGKPYTVRYDAVNAMLLNEFLKEHGKVEELEKEVQALKEGLQKVSAQLELSKPAPRTVSGSQ